MIHVYGIRNCDTVKKALKWLDNHDVVYDFKDYKKGQFDKDVTKRAIDQHGWDKVINKRGTTWRKLDDEAKENMDASSALLCAYQNPSIIKRPLIDQGGDIILGFDEETYADAF